MFINGQFYGVNFMKNIILCLGFILLFSCGESSTRLKVPDDIKTEKLSFATYHKYCGPQNLNNTGNYKKFKGVKVVWSGAVYSVVKDDSSSRYANKVIKIKMKGPPEFMKELLSKKKDEVPVPAEETLTLNEIPESVDGNVVGEKSK